MTDESRPEEPLKQPGGTMDSQHEALARELVRQQRRVRALRLAIYGRDDPSKVDPDLIRQLAEAEVHLEDLGRRLDAAATPGPGETAASVFRSERLGSATTKIQVESAVQMHPIPTGIYHLLDPEVDPLVTVKVTNDDVKAIRRVCVRSFLEGLSAQAVRTVEVEPRKDVVLRFLPTLLPERTQSMTEVQRATLHVVAEDLDGKPERHDTFAVTCLARGSGLNTVRRPETGELVDLTHYYGARVTPHVEEVQRLVRRAADLMPERQLWGYQGGPDAVTSQVEALFNALKEAGIVYINSVINFGAAPGRLRSARDCHAKPSPAGPPTASTVPCCSPACWNPPRSARR